MKSSVFGKSPLFPLLPNNKSLDLFCYIPEDALCEPGMLRLRIFLQRKPAPLLAISVDQARLVSQDEHYLADSDILCCDANKQLSPC